MAEKPRIALGMSGGVDSAVSAALLMRAGYEVVGVTCLFFDDETALGAQADAKAVCDLLGIAHVVWDCAPAFEAAVIEPFVGDYASGLTPSPCVSCNARCKIPSLIACADSLACAWVATGHYARVARLTKNNRFVIKTALDASKDQSYMLAQLSQDQLARLVFPLGGTTKAEVRIIAQDLGFSVADKPESQDVCFIKGGYVDFLKERGLADEAGAIVNAAGEVLGQHTGLFRYTLGQRKGIGVAAGEPYYVIGKRRETKELVVGFHDETTISEVLVGKVNWMAFDAPPQPLECMVKLRYRSRPAACVVSSVDGGVDVAAEGGDAASAAAADEHAHVRVQLRSPQPTTAPGQYAVFYQGETLLGSGVIVSC